MQGKVHHCCTNRRPGAWLLWRSRTWKWAELQNEWFSRMMVSVSVWSNIKHQKLQNCFHFKHTLILILKRVVGKLFKSMSSVPNFTWRYCNKSNFMNIYGTKSVVSAAAQCQKSEYKWWWTWKVYVAAKCQGLAFLPKSKYWQYCNSEAELFKSKNL